MTTIRKIAAALVSIFTAAQPTPVAAAPVLLPGIEFHDRRKTAAQSHHGYPTKKRALSKVIAVCLHQTACMMGERPARYDGTGSHFVVTRAGRVIWLHDFDRMVAAANGWNFGSVSIEIDGLYAGEPGRKAWDDPSTAVHEQAVQLTPEATRATLQLIAWIRAQCPTVREILAHRQSSEDRQDDPGFEAWRDIALVCGLPTVPNATVTGGRPIPESWDPSQRGVRY